MPFFRYAWLLMLAVVAANVIVYRGRFRRMEAEGLLSPSDSARLLRVIGLGLGGLMLALAALQLAAGWESPFCAYARPLTDPFVLGSWLVTLLWWAAFLAWIFIFGGDALVSRASPALARGDPGRAWPPRAVRVGAVLLALAAVASAIMGLRTPVPGCEPAAENVAAPV